MPTRAVTLLSAATSLTSTVEATPDALVVATTDCPPAISPKRASPVTVKVTATSDTGFPRVSVTVALTALVATPSATAPVATEKSVSSLAIRALLLNVVITLRLKSFTVAVTSLCPTKVLVSVATATPRLSVTTGLTICAPLLASNSTERPTTGLP